MDFSGCGLWLGDRPGGVIILGWFGATSVLNYNGGEDGVRWKCRWMSNRWRHEWIFEGSDGW